MDFISISQSVFKQEIEELTHVSDGIGPEIEKVVDMIYTCPGKVVVTGIGKTGLIGRKIAASLASTGTKAIFMNATDAMHGDLGMVSAGDVVLAISNSGSTVEISNILTPLRKIGASIVALTGHRNSPLGKEADVVLNIGVRKEACPLGLAPTTSTTATLVMGDALTICLMKRRGFTEDEYALFHPGGALGRRLLTHVEDIMSTDIPIVKESDFFKDVIYTVSDSRKGMTMVVNDKGIMTGIITDGDIRRAVQNFEDIVSKRAIDFMTHGFKKVASKTQIEEALRLMTNNKITSLAVTETDDPSRIIGIITIHDIIVDYD